MKVFDITFGPILYGPNLNKITVVANDAGSACGIAVYNMNRRIEALNKERGTQYPEIKLVKESDVIGVETIRHDVVL